MAKVNLIKQRQIESNLRRTASRGLMSILDLKELELLALKYYGVFSDGKFIGYTCPYSGELLTKSSEIVLEHIIPVSSNGGTVLFNCIPTSSEVNAINEKGAQHLLAWWLQKEYFDSEKLAKLLSYVFEAYDIVFKKYTVEELESSYAGMEITDEEEIDDYADLITSSKIQAQIIKEQSEKTGIISYLGFINDCIEELKRRNYDTTKYEAKLKEYENNNIFQEIDRYTLFQSILKQIIKSKLELEDRSELTYMLNININKLINSMSGFQTEEEIYNEIQNRIDNIENILEQNNIGLLSFFTDLKNNDILYKNINEITQTDIDSFVNEINLCVSDKFNKMCEFVIKNKGNLPSSKAKSEKEKQLGYFRNNIQFIQSGQFYIKLRKNQLEYLHNSEYESLKNIYKVILNKAVKNNINIAYVDEVMKQRIEEFNQRDSNLSIEEQIKLEQEYKDVISIDSQFNEFINFVINNNGVLPNKNSQDEKEKKLGNFKNSIQHIQSGKLTTKLNKKQLEYLYNSEYKGLREIYKVILNKAIENNIELEYMDEKMKQQINEFRAKNIESLSIEEQIKLEQEYKDIIIIDSQFNGFINFVIENNGKLPSNATKNEEEKKLGKFRNRIQYIQNGNFAKKLNKKQLEYLHNSEYKDLREIYKVILNEAIKNNIELEYVDEVMRQRIEEFNQRNSNLSIEEQIKLEQEYKDVIITDSQFNGFINFVIENNGKLPNSESKNEKEKKLGIFKNSIQCIQSGKFNTKLNKKQLEYLHNSEYKDLREMYKVILNKAIENNIELEYFDEKMKQQIKEFKAKNIESLSIEEQIKLEQEYKDIIIIDSQFNGFINFVIENNGKLPKSETKNEQEKRLGKFRNRIQVTQSGKFHTKLNKKQLEYLHNSEYKDLREIYKVILNEAIKNNIELEYVDEKMKQQIKEFRSKNIESLSIEEQIKLEQEYKDVIIIDSQFNGFINFVIENKGKIPTESSKNEQEKRLGKFRGSIQYIKNGNFHTKLNKKQLEYLHNSEYPSLKQLYDNIMRKAYEINFQEYIDINNELENLNMKGKVA